MENEEALAIRQVLAGNRDAYRVLMDRHFLAVHRIAFRITGNESDAEEAAQEAFLRAYNKLPSFRQDSTFSTWITRIAMNTSLNLVERRNRDLAYTAPRVADSEAPADHTIQLADNNASPERLLLDREAATLRRAAMDALTPAPLAGGPA
jgi:RNA polymerase sigma-70 factor (ECF subfamily)